VQEDDVDGHGSFNETLAGADAIYVAGDCDDGYIGTPWRLCYPNGTWSETQSPCEGTPSAAQCKRWNIPFADP